MLIKIALWVALAIIAIIVIITGIYFGIQSSTSQNTSNVAPFAVPFRLAGDPSDVQTFSSPPISPALLGQVIDLKNLSSDPLVVKNYYCRGMYSIRGLNASLPAIPNQAEVDGYFIAAANQFRSISGLLPFKYDVCLSLNGYATALAALSPTNTDRGPHSGFGAILAGQSNCTAGSAAEGLVGTQNYMPWWGRIQAGMCLLMGDAGHRDPFMNPRYSRIGYNFFPTNGDLKATTITFRLEYG